MRHRALPSARTGNSGRTVVSANRDDVVRVIWGDWAELDRLRIEVALFPQKLEALVLKLEEMTKARDELVRLARKMEFIGRTDEEEAQIYASIEHWAKAGK